MLASQQSTVNKGPYKTQLLDTPQLMKTAAGMETIQSQKPKHESENGTKNKKKCTASKT